MLAKTPLTADQLGITEAELDALHWVRSELMTGAIRTMTQAEYDNSHSRWPLDPALPERFFEMALTHRDAVCGTIACIGGWMALRQGLTSSRAHVYVETHHALHTLFYPMNFGVSSHRYKTVAQAIGAIDRFLDGERDAHALWSDEEAA